MLVRIGNVTNQFRNAKAKAAFLGVLESNMVPSLKQTIGPCVSLLHDRSTLDLLKSLADRTTLLVLHVALILAIRWDKACL